MIEVFKTNIQYTEQAELIIKKLLEYFPNQKINFDLEDCDKILRLEGDFMHIDVIIDVLKHNGFDCEFLD